jgi:hypothetical protein
MENLRRLASDAKTDWPGWFKPIDLAVLMVLGCGDGPLRISHPTLARRCAASVSSVQRSLVALEDRAKWITSKSGARILTANTYEVCWERIPWTGHKKTVVTETAVALATYYAQMWKHARPERMSRRGTTYKLELPKNFKSRWPHVIQKHGLDTGNTAQAIAAQIADMAIAHVSVFAKGPQAWLEKWDTITKKGAAK